MPEGWCCRGVPAASAWSNDFGGRGPRRIAITMARWNGNAFVTNFSAFDAPLPTKGRVALANIWKKVRTRSGCCGNYGQPGC
jgi:hypothetical protein